MKRFIYACLSAYISISCGTIQTETTCLHPDVPENGNYTSEHTKLQPGDEITYRCNKGFALSGKERRLCKTSGQWSDHTPFCDPAAKLKHPIVWNDQTGSSTLPGASTIDGSIKTCQEMVLRETDYIKVPLANKIVIRTIRIFFKKAPINIQISTGTDRNVTFRTTHISFLESDQWIVIQCEGNLFVDVIKIGVPKTSRFSICEIEVYGKTEEGCDYSPIRKIDNGCLEVSRSKAVLICDEGFKIQGNSRLVCEGNNTWNGGPLICEEILCGIHLSLEQPGVKWTYPNMSKKLTYGTIGQLTCAPGYKLSGKPDTISCQKDGMWSKTEATCIEVANAKEKVKRIVIGVVALVVIIIIIALLATIIYFIRKQKRKEVVVVYQPKSEENINSPLEYECPPYESLESKPPELPSTPRPLAKLSTMSRGGDTQSTTWKATYVKNPWGRPPVRPGDAMKPSTIYGS